jgi:hypothetical protein
MLNRRSIVSTLDSLLIGFRGPDFEWDHIRLNMIQVDKSLYYKTDL